MKNSTPKSLKKLTLKQVYTLVLFLMFVTFSFAQTSIVEVSVNWPNWSSENRVEIYDPSNTLIATIDNGYNGCCDDSYSTTVSLGCIPDGNNYYIIMYDTYGDGWNGGASNITITSSGSTVLTNSGASANASGTTLNFNVSGGCSGSCSSIVSSFPYNEDFESGIGQWTQSSTDDFDWTKNQNGTPSNNTGPNSANGGNWYLYTEASSNFNNTSDLISPCFDLSSASSANFSFYYHMYGSNMGTLSVDLSTNNGVTFDHNIFSVTGQQHTSNGSIWSLASIDLSAYLGQTVTIKISGTTGSNYRSDMAIDDISLTAVTTPLPEIAVEGNSTDILNNDITPSTADDTDFGSINVAAGSATHTFTINNTGLLTLNLTDPSPYISISGPNSGDFTLTSTPSSSISAGNFTTFDITFDPSGNGLRGATVSIANNDSNENPFTFNIQGYGLTPLSEGPGGVTTDLELWLKANDGAGLSDNQPLSTWFDQANTNNATVHTSGQEPSYRDIYGKNVNYNAVVDFNNTPNAPYETNLNYTPQQYLEGSTGFHTQDIFIVAFPEETVNSSYGAMDMFCGDANPGDNTDKDVTGIGWGGYTVRMNNEVLTYAISSTPEPNPSDINLRGYGVAQTGAAPSYNNVGIINARNNSSISPTAQEVLYNGVKVDNYEVGSPQFTNINNSNYWIGRSQAYRASYYGTIAEIITFSSRKNNASVTDERNRIESYLAIKYGITLGVNGTSKDYVASDGTIIWDTSANTGYNYDIAGIGRDDNSDLYQKQSKSVNNSAIVSFSLNNTELTNNLNSQTFNTSNEYLVWGNNGQNTNSSATSIVVSLGPATVTTVTDVMNRVWKIVETAGDDVGTVELSVFESDLAGLPPLTGNDAYVMLVADDPTFFTNLRTVFLDPSTFNGIPTREGTFDFDGTKYFTIGIAHEEVRERQLGFDGIDNYTNIGDKVDLAGSFTASAWVKPDGANALGTDKTILAKNNGTVGYKLFLTNNNYPAFSVGTNTTTDRIDANTQLPDNVWHHVAVTYDGTTANIYIDGVLDNTKIITSSTPNGSSLAIGAVYIDKSNIIDFFKGDLDEIRIWDRALTLDQLRFVMNQELIENASMVNGDVLPTTVTKNDISVVNWNNLLAYYNMNSYIGTHLNDVSGNGNRGSLAEPSEFNLEYQTSPLPYTTTSNGLWTNNSSWTNGAEQYIPGSASIVDPTITVDWNIVETSHNITMDNASLPTTNNLNRSVLGLFVTANELELSGDTATNAGNGLTITHYLKIDGKIDLEGESQLIQTTDSDLDPTSSGSLERDQQGTRDLYTYNFWASPVGMINSTTNNNSYTLPNVFRDGTNPAAPTNINFITNGYNGSSGSPIGIADYWIWKYANQSGAYADWQHVRSTGSLLPGEGFTMKGVANTSGNVTLEQNYIYQGKPNNGDITLPITVNNEYLVGNPYASAIDAHQFIMDNAPTIDAPGATTGTLYFWEHWGGGSHLLAEYQGGYATYNLSGATPAASYGTNDPMVATGGTPSKLPGRYIPVGQGFFVKSEATGTIRFTNAQRVFEKEGSSSSTFVRTANTNETASAYNIDNRLKIRLGINTVNGIHRQLLVTQDSHATPSHDWGYDGEIKQHQVDDMYWMIEGKKFIIQGTDVIDVNTVLPIGIHTDDSGNNTFTIDALENVPDNLEIYIFDNATSTYHDIRANDFTINLPAGEYLDRFSMVFSISSTLSIEDNVVAQDINTYYNNNQTSIIINNPKLYNIISVKLYNILSQEIFSETDIDTSDYTALKTGKLSTGTYIIKMKTDIGEISKKVLIE
ncbi:LamG-like jellyroll fold domain-containing protein [Mesoflavibacter sp. SCSIO 43206]|uniref:LamG-like jellyroll fold domain-containing protein n=1 Tax=Mesoflavibacter sp. SCSIO 43206 TaxID=2779362 RepID=UPI001CAA076B|nr:LamG-like jellyroll fold domain-containing protein [Mesoflavibacter sp. SCSIO 43206]UAB75452.1 choice-of-anchor D domain-containing protein [Mesoflavibacter sp. SCSIO 43206]